MSKAIACLVVFCICVVVTFSVMLHLIINIDPPPLEIEKSLPKKIKTKIFKIIPATPKRRHQHLFFDDDGSVSIIDPTQYGLDKIENEELEFYPASIGRIPNRNIQNLTNVLRFTRRKLIAPLWPRTAPTIAIDSTMDKVYSPNWPHSYSSSNISNSTSSYNSINMSAENPEQSYNNGNYTDTNATLEKFMKRRSVSNSKLDECYGTILLKILDNNNQSRLEITLGSDSTFENKPKDTKIILNNNTVKSMEHKASNFTKETVITILSNNKVVIDEIENTINTQHNVSEIVNVSDIVKPLVLGSNADQNDINRSITKREDNVALNKGHMVCLYGDMLIKVMIKNETNLMNNMTSVNGYEMTTNTVFDIGNNTFVSKTKSDSDGMLDIRINVTEFIEHISEDITTKNFEISNKDDSINGSLVDINIAQNGTDDFIESDNDIVVV